MLLRKRLEPRRYQETIFATAARHNTLVVLPTGMGKTMIAVLLTIHRLKQYTRSKVLILAPTKPLAQQHERTFREFIEMPDDKFVLFTGAVPPKKRQKLWDESQIVFSTPQGLENDVLGRKIKLDDVSLMVFDESHRAVGDYSYVYIAKEYEKQARNHHVLALTASPGTDEESITEVCDNLKIEEIEVRSQDAPDVKPYVQELEIEWVQVKLPEEMLVVKRLLETCYKQRLSELKRMGVLKRPHVKKRTLLEMQGQLQGAIARGERDFDIMKAVSVTAESLKIYHAMELLNTQGMYALKKYMNSLQEQATKGQSKAVINVVKDVTWKTVKVKVESLIDKKIEHPKIRELQRIISRSDDEKTIIFTQYRDQAVKILDALDEINVSGKIFVGQMKKGSTGMSQKEQKAILDEFRNGGFRCLIATSVAEEGLDIPKVDLVLFYEPIPSAIRTVQRRGRTGRSEKGKVAVLVTSDTSDVGYRWSAHHKEKRMYRAIESVRKNFKVKPQRTLQQFDDKRLKIVCDYREKASPVMKELVEHGATIELQQLAVGDYQLSDRVVVEYKRIPDFVDSMIDGRLLAQLKALRQYTRPIIILEGVEDIYSVRKVHPNAIRGMLATIAVSYNIPILMSRSAKETVGLLIALVKREQIGGQDWQYHSSKPLTDDELQEYIVASFPGIGSNLAKPLLDEFKSIKKIVNASEDELKKVQLIGEKKAKRLKEISEKKYKS